MIYAGPDQTGRTENGQAKTPVLQTRTLTLARKSRAKNSCKTSAGLVALGSERASYNGSIEASQASDMGSIPIARSINPVDAVDFDILIWPHSIL
jgi:hypothetical protein